MKAYILPNLETSKNMFDTKDSLEIGQKAEISFKNIATRRGWQCLDAGDDENINQHWDYQIKNEISTYKIDIKAMKRIWRDDPLPQDTWVWIELHGVRNNDKGWLYAGKADLLAFETVKSFVIVEREELIALVEKIMPKPAHIVYYPCLAVHNIYSRQGRFDQLTLIHINDLRAILWDEWSK